jgi:hypothetical protein
MGRETPVEKCRALASKYYVIPSQDGSIYGRQNILQEVSSIWKLSSGHIPSVA